MELNQNRTTIRCLLVGWNDGRARKIVRPAWTGTVQTGRANRRGGGRGADAPIELSSAPVFLGGPFGPARSLVARLRHPVHGAVKDSDDLFFAERSAC